jgi:hypothetical protein
MSEPVDLDRLAEIPDPFPDAGSSPMQPGHATRAAYSPTRLRVRAIRAGAAVLALLYVAGWPAFVRRRADLGSVQPAELALEFGIPLLVAGLAVVVSGRLGRSGLGDRKAILALVLGSPALFAAAMAWTLPDIHVDRFWPHTLRCMLLTAILAAGPLAVAVYAFRHAFASLAAWRTAGLGLATGALAAATIALVCPIDDAWHVLVGHGTMMLVAGAIGGLLGRRVCRA